MIKEQWQYICSDPTPGVANVINTETLGSLVVQTLLDKSGVLVPRSA